MNWIETKEELYKFFDLPNLVYSSVDGNFYIIDKNGELIPPNISTNQLNAAAAIKQLDILVRGMREMDKNK